MVFRFLVKISKCVSVAVFILMFYQIARHLSSRHETKAVKTEDVIMKAHTRNVRRVMHLQKVCRRYNLGMYRNTSFPAAFKEPPAPQYEVFFYDLSHKLSWCPIYKSGTSTWLFNLALLGGYTEDEILKANKQINDVVRKILPVLESDEAKKALERSLKFLIVRHPFERILSAYRDKLENVAVRGIDGTHHFYRSYGSKIVAKYRPGGNSTNTRKLLKPNQYIWNEEKQPIGIEPTFREFVNYLIDIDLRTRADDHWIPYYLFCTPCMIKYDVIGKLETMMEDQIYIIHTANIQDEISPRWRHKTNPFNDGRTIDGVSDVAKIYFGQLNENHVRELYKKYQLDFELFQYDESEYYKYVER